MKLFVAILMSLTLCLPALVKTAVVGHYNLNKVEITYKFCVNKDKPDMKCEGKCHMKQQLAKVTVTFEKESSKNTAPSPQDLSKLDVSVYDLVAYERILASESKKIKQYSANSLGLVKPGHCILPFTPPDMA